MSASNWRRCPKCLARAEAAKQAKCRKAMEAYGKVPIEEYNQMAEEALNVPELEEMLREDYHFHMSSAGLFSVGYRGECQVPGCHFLHTFSHKEQLDLSKPTKENHAR